MRIFSFVFYLLAKTIIVSLKLLLVTFEFLLLFWDDIGRIGNEQVSRSFPIIVGEPKKKQVIKQLVKLLPFRECHLMSISVDSTRITPPCGQFEISRKYMDLLLFLKLEE